jgi:hypothetical protein
MDCISLWVGGSLTIMPSVLTEFVLLLVPLIALLRAEARSALVTSPGGPWDPSLTLGKDVTDEGHLVPTGMMDRGRDALRALDWRTPDFPNKKTTEVSLGGFRIE